MDKYEFNIKVEQIKKMANSGDYETAMKIADTIDWRRVRNVNILSMVATIYEKNEEFQESKDILLLAFERAPIGKRLLFKLAELAIKEGSLREAEDYYREFCDLTPDDPRQYILRYMILNAKGAPVEQLIHTLEQYCGIELDEKWLYKLAELYAEAGMGELCIMACDKIMLMFGLGKYVEKAMELKIQFAPLTKYQMDLVENRDKYEAKLRAVENEYRMGGPVEEYDEDPSDIPVLEKTHKYRPSLYDREAAVSRMPDLSGGNDYGGRVGYDYAGDTGYEENEEQSASESGCGNDCAARETHAQYADEQYADEQYVDEQYADEQYAKEPYADDGLMEEEPPHTQVTIEEEEEPALNYRGASGRRFSINQPEESGEEKEEPSRRQWMIGEMSENMSDEALKSRIHEAQVQASLAMEMSRMSGSGFREEALSAQTRVLTDIRDINKETAHKARHLMIEAQTPREGLEQAVEILKEIHRENGAIKQAAKITGERLNSRGIFNLSDKLTDKDLMIEQAGDMTEGILQELNQLMARDETGMNVVLIDTAERLADIYKIYPGLAKRFEYIGTAMPPQENEYEAPREDKRPVRKVQIHREGIPGEAGKEAGPVEAASGLPVKRSRPVTMQANPMDPSEVGNPLVKEEMDPPLESEKNPFQKESFTPREMNGFSQAGSSSQGKNSPGQEAKNTPSQESFNHQAENALFQSEFCPPGGGHPLQAGANPQAKNSAPQTSPAPRTENIPSQAGANPQAEKTHSQAGVNPQAKNAPSQESFNQQAKKPPQQAIPQEKPQEENLEEEEMDIDEFAKYASEYAASIDCSISGKSMLALYERIEIMEEDGVALTKENGEDLIEEAADRAENPSFFRRMARIFSSRYDKDGLLILKEEHFI